MVMDHFMLERVKKIWICHLCCNIVKDAHIKYQVRTFIVISVDSS